MYPTGQSSPYGQPTPYGQQQTDYAQPFPPAQQRSNSGTDPFAQAGPGVPPAQVAPHRRAALYCYTEPADEGAGAQSSSEEEEPSFGRAGQMVFWGGGATFLGTRMEGKDSRESSTGSTVDIAPSFGFFLSKLILLRAATHIWRSSGSVETQYGFGLETGIGFHIPATRVVSLVPEVRLGIGWVQHDCFGGYYDSCSDDSNLQYWNSVGLPVLFHLAPHLFIGAGPAITYTFTKTDSYGGPGNSLSLSLQGLIGGWL